jgi:hypothetical protein
LRFQCPYTRFFEPFAPTDHPFAKRLVQMPRPFSLQVPPPSNSPVTFKVGDAFSFGMTIWHQAENLLPISSSPFKGLWQTELERA